MYSYQQFSDLAFRKKALIIFGVLTLDAFIFAGIAYAYIIHNSPDRFSYPEPEHLHFRMQYVYNGIPENFALEKYQEPYNPMVCAEPLTESPIHFHDGKDQYVHIHWKNMTGGDVLKYFGLNMIGGQDDSMGYHLADIMDLHTIPIHGFLLPKPQKDQTLFIYIGDEKKFEKVSLDNFLKQTLEETFGQKSSFISSFFDIFISKVYAHGHPESDIISQEKIAEINNLLGNVIIFVQNTEPTQEEIRSRFDKLVPLEKSTCSG